MRFDLKSTCESLLPRRQWQNTHFVSNWIIIHVWFIFSLNCLYSSPSLCKGRTLYSVVRDVKVVLDVNKTRQIAQEMVKVQLNSDSHKHVHSTHRSTPFSDCVRRGWATSMQRGSYTKTWSPRMCFTTTAKSSLLILDSSPYLEFCRPAGDSVVECVWLTGREQRVHICWNMSLTWICQCVSKSFILGLITNNGKKDNAPHDLASYR